jgi:hypothetical protein
MFALMGCARDGNYVAVSAAEIQPLNNRFAGRDLTILSPSAGHAEQGVRSPGR